MTAEPYRVLVLGTGFATRVQIPVFETHPRFEVVAVSSRSAARAAQVAADFKIPAHGTDWRALIESDEVDAVSVVTEVAEHVEPAVAALWAGKHLLLEKPMAMNLGEGRRIQAAAAEAPGVFGAINHEFRYQPDVLTLKRMIDDGELGELRAMEVRGFFEFWADPKAPTHGWLSRSDRGGGILGALGSHMVDQVRFVTGREVVSAEGSVETVLATRNDASGAPQPVTADDAAAFVMTLEGGLRVNVTVYASLWWNENVTRVFGDRGTATIDGGGTVLVRSPSGETQVREPDPALALPTGDPDIRKALFFRLLDRFAVRCDGETVTDLATLEDGVRTMEVLEAVRSTS